MAIRGKVKDIRTMPAGRLSGTVTDTATKIDYPFEQPYGVQLGLQVNSIVQFETIESGGTTYGVSLDPVEKGTIQSINYELGNGVLLDRLGNAIDFEQYLCREMGILEASVVRYVPVTVNGQRKATSLKLAVNS